MGENAANNRFLVLFAYHAHLIIWMYVYFFNCIKYLLILNHAEYIFCLNNSMGYSLPHYPILGGMGGFDGVGTERIGATRRSARPLYWSLKNRIKKF